MKIYLSTPINGRPEYFFEQKKKAAFERCKELAEKVRLFLGDDAEMISPFDVNPYDQEISEERAMGKCIAALLECDAVLFDEGYPNSKGCMLEYHAATLYGKDKYFVSVNAITVKPQK